MRAHVIENGIVVNTIEVNSLDFMPNLVSAESGGAIGDQYENGVFSKPEIPLNDTKASRIADLAALRYQHETAGITLNGATIKTDRESQALITGAYAYSQLDPSALIDWKATTGWIQIDATAIAGIATAVACHVQDCFSNERTLSEAIAAAESVEAVQQIDLTIGWP